MEPDRIKKATSTETGNKEIKQMEPFNLPVRFGINPV